MKQFENLKSSEKLKSPESIPASNLQSKIELIDKAIFLDKPLKVRLDTDIESQAEASHHFDDNDLDNIKEHFYTVWVKGIQNNQLARKDNPEKEILRIALHEVRHRVQHDLNVKMLNISDLKKFIVENPKTSLETYFSSPDYKKFLDYIVSSNKSENDFDAMVVEDIAMKLLKGNYDDESIKKISNAILKQSAGVIIDYLNSLQSNS